MGSGIPERVRGEGQPGSRGGPQHLPLELCRQGSSAEAHCYGRPGKRDQRKVGVRMAEAGTGIAGGSRASAASSGFAWSGPEPGTDRASTGLDGQGAVLDQIVAAGCVVHQVPGPLACDGLGEVGSQFETGSESFRSPAASRPAEARGGQRSGMVISPDPGRACSAGQEHQPRWPESALLRRFLPLMSTLAMTARSFVSRRFWLANAVQGGSRPGRTLRHIRLRGLDPLTGWFCTAGASGRADRDPISPRPVPRLLTAAPVGSKNARAAVLMLAPKGHGASRRIRTDDLTALKLGALPS